MSVDNVDLVTEDATDRIEEAKSSRSKCRACGAVIEKGELRFGEVIVEGHDFMQWYHLACAQARVPERLAPVLATNAAAIAALASSNDAVGRLISVERAKGRASCRACAGATLPGSWRVAVRLDPDPANPQFAAKGYIHLACARAFADGAEVAPYLAKRTAKLPKEDRQSIADVLAAAELVARDPRGAALAGQARDAKQPAKKSKKARAPDGALAVFADWLEETHDLVLAEADLAQVAGIR